jgi:hypothetical protein
MKMNAKAKSRKKLFVCRNKCIIKFAMRGSEKRSALLLKFFLYENERGREYKKYLIDNGKKSLGRF